MGLIVGQNSWVTVDEADTYLTLKINAEAWFALDVSSDPGELGKSTLLITAFFWLKSSPQLNLSSSLTDDFIKNAQIEAALFLLEHHDALNARRAAMFTGVEEFDLSKKSEKLNIKNLLIPSHIIGMLGLYTTDNVFTELAGHYDA